MKACIFLDIDGTLLDHEIGIQESSRIAIAQAQANGHQGLPCDRTPQAGGG